MRVVAPCLAGLLLCCASSSKGPGGAAPASSSPAAPAGPANEASAREFVRKTNEDLLRLSIRSNTADWIKNTYITDDTERVAAAANDEDVQWVDASVFT